MNQIRLNRTTVVTLLLSALMGCREVTIVNQSYQRVVINDFSAPLRTLLPSNNGIPNSLILRVSGTISQPVVLVVNNASTVGGKLSVRRDTLAAGSYTNKFFSGDYYSNEETELIVTGMSGTTGSLIIEWYRR